METAWVIIFWVVVIGFFVIRRMYRSGSLSSAPAPASIAGVQTGAFEARVKWVDTGDDELPSHYRVEFRGRLVPRGEQGLYVRNFLLDTTDKDDPAPVIALLDWQQASDSVMFLDVTDIGVVPADSFLNLRDWESFNLLMFPEVIKGPYSGQRTLTAELSVRTYDGAVIWEKSVPFVAELPVAGYIEDAEREKVDDRLIVRLAVAVAAVSGGMDDEELTVIRDWSQARISYLDEDDDERSERASALNGALAMAVKDADADQLDVGATIDALMSDGSESGRIEAVELAFAVIRADGVADTEEMALVNRIAQRLEVDEAWFSEHRDKSLSGVTFEAGSQADCSTILGIDASAPQDEIRRQLNEQYDRWSSRAVSMSDPDKRREAEEMLEMIARCRAQLLG